MACISTQLLGHKSKINLCTHVAILDAIHSHWYSLFHFQIRLSEFGYLEVLLDGSNITDEITNSFSSFSSLVNIQRPSDMMSGIESTSSDRNSTLNMNRIESTFSNGISVTVTLLSGILNVVTILPQDFMGLTQGLLGNFNGNDTDDFIYPNGTMLNNNASDRMIHNFGMTCKFSISYT